MACVVLVLPVSIQHVATKFNLLDGRDQSIRSNLLLTIREVKLTCVECSCCMCNVQHIHDLVHIYLVLMVLFEHVYPVNLFPLDLLKWIRWGIAVFSLNFLESQIWKCLNCWGLLSFHSDMYILLAPNNVANIWRGWIDKYHGLYIGYLIKGGDPRS